VSISGNLRTMPFADLLQWVSQSRKTGTLAVEGDPYNKKIYFRDGMVVAASSENPKEFLGYYLVGWRYLGEDELQELLDMQDRHGTLLGELLVIVGRLNREQLLHVLQIKTEEAIYDLFLWEEGDFRFLENILPAKKFQPLNVPVDTLILEGVRRRDEWERCREAIDDVSWIPKVVRAVDVHDLGESELAILREINGSNSIEDIALACRIPLFHALLFVYQGHAHGLFALLPPESDAERAIPGFSSSSWRLLVKQTEKLIADGDLAAAHAQIEGLRQKYGDKREVKEHANALEDSVRNRLDEASISDGSVLELAIPAARLTTLPCSPQEGFLLSRVNGSYTVAEIVRMMPGTPLEVRLTIDALMRRDVLRVKDGPAPGHSRDVHVG
jgi:hypothetical protein